MKFNLLKGVIWYKGLKMRVILQDNFKDKATMDFIDTLRIYLFTYIANKKNVKTHRETTIDVIRADVQPPPLREAKLKTNFVLLLCLNIKERVLGPKMTFSAFCLRFLKMSICFQFPSGLQIFFCLQYKWTNKSLKCR